MNIKEKNFTIWDRILNIFYPERCPYCTKVIHQGMICCDDCKEEFTGIEYHTYARGGYLTVSAVPYTGIFAEGIKRFKFRKGKQYSYQLAMVMAEAIRKQYKDYEFDMITYVPMHPRNFKERGYNQSELLAKDISAILSIPFVTTLKKTRYTQPQHSLKKASDREKNVKNAYRLTDKSIVKGKRVLLIDDIFTTGNTLGECARILNLGEASEIMCATFAIAIAKTT